MFNDTYISNLPETDITKFNVSMNDYNLIKIQGKSFYISPWMKVKIEKESSIFNHNLSGTYKDGDTIGKTIYYDRLTELDQVAILNSFFTLLSNRAYERIRKLFGMWIDFIFINYPTKLHNIKSYNDNIKKAIYSLVWHFQNATSEETINSFTLQLGSINISTPVDWTPYRQWNSDTLDYIQASGLRLLIENFKILYSKDFERKGNEVVIRELGNTKDNIILNNLEWLRIDNSGSGSGNGTVLTPEQIANINRIPNIFEFIRIKQDISDNALTTLDKTITGAINELNTNIGEKQQVDDYRLTTTNKNIVGAINEINAKQSGGGTGNIDFATLRVFGSMNDFNTWKATVPVGKGEVVYVNDYANTTGNDRVVLYFNEASNATEKVLTDNGAIIDLQDRAREIENEIESFKETLGRKITPTTDILFTLNPTNNVLSTNIPLSLIGALENYDDITFNLVKSDDSTKTNFVMFKYSIPFNMQWNKLDGTRIGSTSSIATTNPAEYHFAITANGGQFFTTSTNWKIVSIILVKHNSPPELGAKRDLSNINSPVFELFNDANNKGISVKGDDGRIHLFTGGVGSRLEWDENVNDVNNANIIMLNDLKNAITKLSNQTSNKNTVLAIDNSGTFMYEPKADFLYKEHSQFGNDYLDAWGQTWGDKRIGFSTYFDGTNHNPQIFFQETTQKLSQIKYDRIEFTTDAWRTRKTILFNDINITWTDAVLTAADGSTLTIKVKV